MTLQSPRLAILASGTGTLLEAVIEAGLEIAVVVSDRDCRALRVAASSGLQAELLQRYSFGAEFDRNGYSAGLVELLGRHRVDVVAMAGFATVLTGPMFERYAGRVLNTHPSLLPAFKGWHAVRDALEAGVAVTGATVHVATELVDEGPILAQEEVPVLAADSESSLHERIKQVERRLYPETIRAFLASISDPELNPGGTPEQTIENPRSQGATQ
ncbi:MAG: phosphoribosylglycinamide formyltransferase [Acidimicrobiales bacterium]